MMIDVGDVPGNGSDAHPEEHEVKPAPGDDAPEGTPGTGENMCPECGGNGLLNGRTCPHCDGTGVVIEGIGGG